MKIHARLKSFIKHQNDLFHGNSTNPKKVAMFFELIKIPSLMITLLLMWNICTNPINPNIYYYLLNDYLQSKFLGIILITLAVYLKVLFALIFLPLFNVFIEFNSRY